MNSTCVAPVLIFLESSLEKSNNNFVQLMNKLPFFLVYIISVECGKIECLAGEEINRLLP